MYLNELLFNFKMSKQSLTDFLTGKLAYPIQGMEKFPVGKFSQLIEQFGTTDFEKVVKMPQYERIISEGMILGYAEKRMYNGVEFGYHWGIDVMCESGTPVYAVDSGVIIKVNSIDDLSDKFTEQKYGNNLIVLNKYEDQEVFTLYGHLGCIRGFTKGQKVAKCEQIGVVGKAFTVENGGWPPHLHLQIALSMQGLNPYAGKELEELTIDLEKVFRLG